jgi:hypothetical protein
VKRLGPPNGSGSRSGRKLRVAGEHSPIRSDAGRASPTSHSPKSLSTPTAPGTVLAGGALTIVLRARGRSRFDALLDETQIVKSSAQPICDAARALHRLGHSDDRRLTVWHEGSSHHAISGRLGFWRKRRIREDRGMPRYVRWEPRPRRVDAKNGRSKLEAVEHRAKKRNASTTAPGADKGLSPATPTSKAGGTP